MGQKSNPNSFQLSKKSNNIFFSAFNSLEYSNYLKDYLSISSNVINFFEKNKCIVNDCQSVLYNKMAFVTIFINFVVLTDISKKPNNNFLEVSFILKKFWSVLNRFGYSGSKRLILQNLNKLVLDKRNINFEKKTQESFKFFRNEVYFDSGNNLFYLLCNTTNNANLFAKFIAFYFKKYHRSAKINKFFNYLQKFVVLIVCKDDTKFNSLLEGIKIQIKGRFRGASRTKIRVFEAGSIPLQTICKNVRYSQVHVSSSYGVFGIKVWLLEKK
jgi:hypothetical protein